MICPTDEELRCFVLAECDPDEAEMLERHIDQCSHCFERLCNLERHVDGLLYGDLTFTQNGDLSQEGELEELLAMPFDNVSEPLEPVPDFIGLYKITGVLGRGGMGTVYQGEHLHLKRSAAIKIIQGYRSHIDSSVNRFYKEMEAIGKLHHPNIVQAFDAGETQGEPYIVMELLDGMDLSQYVKQHGPFAPNDAVALIRQVAMGLQHAHDAGIVHRDVKPSNIQITPDGTAVLLDLGLARLLNSDTSETATGHIMGSRGYISPEQAQGLVVDYRSDIYSLGRTLLFLILGKTPTTEIGAEIPERIKKILEQMTAVSPDDRLQSMNDVVMVLDENVKQPSTTKGRWLRYLVPLILAVLLFVGVFISQMMSTNSQNVMPQINDTEVSLSTQEVADLLGVSDSTIYRWINQRGLPAHREGRAWRFRKSEIDFWLSQQKQK
ncbi:MAG: protein kinase domain-containing protein [Thermoguttaceae bacterium]